MAKQKTWQTTIEGVARAFTLEIPFGRVREYRLIVDEGLTLLTFPVKWTAVLSGYDVPFTLEGREYRLIVSSNNKNVDLVADGRYLSNGKTYVPLPKWSYIFLIPILPLAFLGGFLGALFGIIGFGICARVAKSTMPGVMRVVLCLVIMGLTWLAYFTVGILLVGGINSL